MRLIIVVFTLLSFGCSASAPDSAAMTKTSCVAQDGIWLEARYADPNSGTCVSGTDDAGHSCQVNRDCQSACVTDDDVKAGERASGQCFAWSELIGHCINRINHEGKAEGTVCYD